MLSNALDAYSDFFETQQAKTCEVYTIVESPIDVNMLIPSNTVLSNPADAHEITVTKARTILSITVRAKPTLG